MASNSKHSVRKCDIAGAVALAALEDVRVNSVMFPGFPEIHVAERNSSKFEISLRLRTESEVLVETFELSRPEAIAAAQEFQNSPQAQEALMERVQVAMASLEKRHGPR